jgi:hypothetical protein
MVISLRCVSRLMVFGGCVSRSDSENRSARKRAAHEEDAADIGEFLDARAG